MATDKDDSTREKVLSTALSILNRYGYGALTLAQLAAESGMTKQRIHYHFPQVDKIVLILAERWSQTGQQVALETLAESSRSGPFKVLSIAEAMFHWIERFPELSRLSLVLFQTSPHVPALDEFMKNARQTARERIKALLLTSQRIQKMRRKDLENLVVDLHSQMYGSAIYAVLLNDFQRFAHDRDTCLRALKTLIEAAEA